MHHRFVGRLDLVGETRGGLAGAAVGLGIVLPLGLLSVSALGPDAASIGVRAAFTSAIVGGLITALVGGVSLAGSIPKTATTLIYASLVATLAADPALTSNHGPDLKVIFALTTLCVVMSGAVQLVFGLLRLGSVIRYVPLPVVAGFMNGVAILIALSSVRALLGLPGQTWSSDVAGTLRQIAGPSLALGVATAVFAWMIARRWPTAPWSLAGFTFGTALYFLIHAMGTGADLGALSGAPASGMSDFALLDLVASPALRTAAHVQLPLLITTAVVIAIIGSMDALVSAAGIATTLHARHDGNRLLIGHGLGNLVVGALGGLPVVYSTAVPLSAHRAGGRGLLAGVVTIVTLLAIVLFGRSLLGIIPTTVSAGVMLIVALGLFDQWSGRVLRQLRVDRGHREARWSLAIVLIVGLVTIMFGFVVGIAAGVVLSAALFMATMNRSLVRSIGTGATRLSRRIYFPEQAMLLREWGARIKLVELEGAVFFGTAEKLEKQVDALADGTRYIILDMKRVTTIDASGAITLEWMARQLQAEGVTLLLAGLLAGDRHGRALLAFGTFAQPTERHWFVDADRALEFAERGLLDDAGIVPSAAEQPFETLSLVDELTVDQRDWLRQRLARLTLATGEVLFRKNELGDRLFVLAKGSVSVLSNSGDAATAQRLSSFAPGVIFGETAMLDGGGRTATAVADEPSVLYVLTRDVLDEIRRTDPALAAQLLFNLSRQLSARMRNATATIQAADY